MAMSDFHSLYNRTALPEMSPLDRERATILIVESDSHSRNKMRQTLITLGYVNIFDAPNHLTALKKISERAITHLIFEAKRTNMPAREFLTKVFEYDDKIVALPTSHQPTIDDVFGLLTVGARGYIVKPFNSHAVEDAIGLATKGEPLSEAILFAKNRNDALASLMLTALGKAATTLRQAQQFETARLELPKRMLTLRRAVDISRLFSDGGDMRLLDAVVEFSIERSNGPATRLGRVRKRLKTKQADKKQLEEQQLQDEEFDSSDAQFSQP